MATQIIGQQKLAVASYSGHTCGIWADNWYYDSVTRSGNTVTVKGLRVVGNKFGRNLTGGSFGWSKNWYCWWGCWTGSTTAGNNPIAKSGTVLMATANSWWNENHIYHSGDVYLNDFSFTVSGSGAGTKTFYVGVAFNMDNTNTTSYRDGTDPAPSFTISYPSNTKYLNVNVNKVDSSGNRTEAGDGSVGKFDEYVPNTTKIGSQVSDQVGWDYAAGSTYKINNVTEQSADWYYTGNSEYSGTLNSDTTIQLDFKATSVPTGLDAALVSRAWNQVVAKATCTGFGAPNNRSGRYVRVYVCKSTDTTFVNYYQQETQNATATGNKTFTSSTTKTGSPDKIIGCMPFKLGVGAHNQKKWAGVVESTVYYLPPAPMASVTLDSTTRNATNVTFKVKATGKAADGTNNISGAKVNLQYRYSTDGGTTYSSWTNAATNYTPNTAQTFNLNIKYNTAVKVQVRQATYQDTTQVTAALTLDIAAVHPIPKDPTLTFSWDELDRIFTSVATNTGTGGDTGDSSLKRLEYQVSWNSDFSSPFVNTTPTTSPYTYTIPYLKPLRTLYVRVRTVNNWDLTSGWVSVSPTVPRPLWGLVKGTSEVTGNVETIEIRDMVKVKTDNTVSTRDWIEGTNNGKKRIVKT